MSGRAYIQMEDAPTQKMVIEQLKRASFKLCDLFWKYDTSNNNYQLLERRFLENKFRIKHNNCQGRILIIALK